MRVAKGAQVINLPELRAELARRGWPQWRLAAELGVGSSTFTGYLYGRATPTNLVTQIEKIMGLDSGVITK